MLTEILTNSGAVVAVTNVDGPGVAEAVAALGGAVTQTETPDNEDAVLRIIDQAIIGTTLTDEDGSIYELWPDGWSYLNQGIGSIPDHTNIVAATMPGGWTWTR